MTQPALAVFTARSRDRILSEGGSQAWNLDPERARRAGYLICCQNRHNGSWGGADREHGSAFLLGRITDVVPSEEEGESEGRYLVRIDAYADIDIPGVWAGWRNPVRYMDLATLGIDLASIKFEPMPGALVPVPGSILTPAFANGPEDRMSHADSPPTAGAVIADAKRSVARAIGVPEAAVEIVIRV